MKEQMYNLRGRQLILVQNLFNHRVKRKSKTIVESRTINSYTFGGRLIHDGICLGDYEGYPAGRRNNLGVGKVTAPTVLRVGAPRNSSSSATISGTSPTGKRPFLLSTDLPGVEELVDAPSKDECLDELSKEEEEVPPEVELVLVEATSALDFDELGAE
ncbi:hypothetical protein Cgig2_025438 [Carnegiea gigantea]|uniref:Uncharacterized protein n=1 Tax=Carnegiea gigantea TaxID=171969 RepID=A0A9Q1QMK4_9CARY|nr:hypothetical protein Cgig2_025438 [Carnegiea gigantea]